MVEKNTVNTNNAIRPGGDGSYVEVIENIQADAICPFCPEHLERIHPHPIFLEAEYWRATDNAWPYAHAAGHVLAIHRHHIETVEELSDEAFTELRTVIEAVMRLKHMRGATLLLRMNDTRFTGASVNHLHAHIVSGTGFPEEPPVLARVG